MGAEKGRRGDVHDTCHFRIANYLKIGEVLSENLVSGAKGLETTGI